MDTSARLTDSCLSLKVSYEGQNVKFYCKKT